MKSHPYLHRLVLLPFVGVLGVAVALFRSEDPEERAELKSALLVQGAASGILLFHLLLQVGIEGVGWFFARTEDLGFAMEGSWVPNLLIFVSVLNIGSGLVEWGGAAFFGLQAAAGKPYPGKRRRLSGSDGP